MINSGDLAGSLEADPARVHAAPVRRPRAAAGGDARARAVMHAAWNQLR